MKILKKICFVLLIAIFLPSCSTTPIANAGSCWDEIPDVADCKVRAEKGGASAQYNLGLMYDYGKGVPQDYKEAVKWYRFAAVQGETQAQYNLGWMFSNGLGSLQDYKEAVKWYRFAAVQGDNQAQNNLALMYYEGKGVKQSKVMAHMYFNIAAVSGNKNAIKGRGLVEKDMTATQIAEAQKLAREWMSKHQ